MALLYLTACARPSALNLAPRASASVEARIVEDLEVVVARQTIEGALANVATPLPPPASVATPDLAAIQTHTTQPQPTNTALPASGAVDKNPVDDATIIYIPAGEFSMGLTEAQIGDLVNICADCNSSDFGPSKPVHKVYIDAFWIYRTETTNGMYALCVAAGSCHAPAQTGSETRPDYWDNPLYTDYPVVYVDWFAADQYCRWAGGRLPTAAEWEKAARGADGRLFPWGNAAPTANLANTKGVMGDTTPVASYPQGGSVYGVQDMAGNVWEWVADWYEADYYAFSAAENPLGPASSSRGRRVGRGGSWYWAGGYASSAYHDWWEPGKIDNGVGFRCAIELT